MELQSGQGRDAKDLRDECVGWFYGAVICFVLICLSMLAGCCSSCKRTDNDAPAEILTDKEVARILRKNFNGL